MNKAREKEGHTEIVDWVSECLEPIGTVTARAMMGGQTLYCDGVVFAIAAAGQLWFKADAETDHEWDAAERERFAYDRDGQTATMNYRLAPDDCYDYPDEMRRWAELGLVAGRRAAAKKKPCKAKEL
ncbi:DNA transformation protein [Novosphingobium fluoreni]|uniref:DNA transformation protein n=1 Tax=Novosphingobium fluoreni TaxID=1391222 RepID=A0A7W6BUS4_9SPHN|nr:TfoX/Sxy family protein [Novosphingobium fluoreni]MBB3938393.1 DNA transformation protein [Novosphingobium fluoreni]